MRTRLKGSCTASNSRGSIQAGTALMPAHGITSVDNCFRSVLCKLQSGDSPAPVGGRDLKSWGPGGRIVLCCGWCPIMWAGKFPDSRSKNASSCCGGRGSGPARPPASAKPLFQQSYVTKTERASGRRRRLHGMAMVHGPRPEHVRGKAQVVARRRLGGRAPQQPANQKSVSVRSDTADA